MFFILFKNFSEAPSWWIINADLVSNLDRKLSKDFVLKVSILGSSKTLIWLVKTLEDRALIKPRFLIFLFNLVNLVWPLCLGPWAIPPPTKMGAVILPCLAPPDPFCWTIFLLDPLTSPLDFVCPFFFLWLFYCQLITNWIKSFLGLNEKTLSETSWVPIFLPSILISSNFILIFLSCFFSFFFSCYCRLFSSYFFCFSRFFSFFCYVFLIFFIRFGCFQICKVRC